MHTLYYTFTCFFGQTDNGFFLKPKHVVVGLKKNICCVHQLYLLVFIKLLTEAVVNLI